MKFYRDEGLVLGHHKLGEADRIVTVLTRSHGLIRAVAKGVRRTKSRFGSRLEPFMMVDISCHVGRSLDIVTQVELIEPFGNGIVSDYEVWQVASVMVEAAAQLTESEPQTVHQYLLLVAALRSLCRREHPPRLSLDAYLLRAMALAGWAASLIDCAICGAAGPHRAFSPNAGGAVCRDCRSGGEMLPGEDALTHLSDLQEARWAEAEAHPAQFAQAGSRVVASYVQWHLERKVKSLAVLEAG